MKHNVTITAWYLNVSRICQLIGGANLAKAAQILGNVRGPVFAFSEEGITQATVKEQLERWLLRNPVPTLGELVTTGKKIKRGQRFTLYHDFYGKGLHNYNNPRKQLPRNAIAELHTKLRFKDSLGIRVLYSPKNLYSQSAWSRLSGHTKLFIFAYIESISSSEIVARPYIIGDLHTDLESATTTYQISNRYGEVHPTSIDSFSQINEIYGKERNTPDLSILKNIPEKIIKEAFAEIIHEGNIPKDWGGEQSDLFSSNVTLDGRKIPTAFLFKGPAKFKPLTVAGLGKNGDQIVRLFAEPADLLILQHCHKVTPQVRSTMRAFACRFYDPRLFCIIDGYDTIRLLTAYRKCGL